MIKRVSVDIHPKVKPRNGFVKWGVHPTSSLLKNPPDEGIGPTKPVNSLESV